MQEVGTLGIVGLFFITVTKEVMRFLSNKNGNGKTHEKVTDIWYAKDKLQDSIDNLSMNIDRQTEVLYNLVVELKSLRKDVDDIYRKIQ